MRKVLNLFSAMSLLIMAIGMSSCGNDEPGVDNPDVYYVTNYEVKFSPNTLIGFIAKANYLDENGDKVEIDLSNSIHHFIPLITSQVPDHLFIQTELTRRAGLDTYDCVVDLGIEVKKFSKIGEYIETVYSKQITPCCVELYPAKQMDNDHFEANFTFEVKKDKHDNLK